MLAMGRVQVSLAVVVVACAAAGCTADAGSPSGELGYVTLVDWTDGAWPFTVPEGVLACDGSDGVTFTADGVTYALNNLAIASGQYHDVREIARYAGGYVEINNTREPVPQNAGAMIDRGRRLCS
jgi:hypothetical protein